MPPRVPGTLTARLVRRTAFLVTMLSLLALVPPLAWVGFRAALAQRTSSKVPQVSDPSAPGFQALVSPTPTLLTVTLNGVSHAPVAVVLLAKVANGNAGTAVVVPARLWVPRPKGGPRAFAEVWQTEGQAAALAGLAQQFQFGFDEVVVLDDQGWADVLHDQGSISFDNSDDVTAIAAGSGRDRTFPAGRVSLGGSDVAAFLGATVPEEDPRAQLFRQELLWRGWLGGDGVAPKTAPPNGPQPNSLHPLRGQAAKQGGAGLVSFVDGFVGHARVVSLPATVVEPLVRDRSDVFDFETSPANLAEFLADVVPFPAGAQPGDRIRVRLLDGVGNRATTLAAAAQLVPAGAEIALFGNASRYDYLATVVEYYDEHQRGAADTLAAALGVGRAQAVQAGQESVDVTVIIGRDFKQQDR